MKLSGCSQLGGPLAVASCNYASSRLPSQRFLPHAPRVIAVTVTESVRSLESRLLLNHGVRLLSLLFMCDQLVFNCFYVFSCAFMCFLSFICPGSFPRRPVTRLLVPNTRASAAACQDADQENRPSQSKAKLSHSTIPEYRSQR